VNIASIIEGHPDDAPALVSRGNVTTYGDLRRQVSELRGGLVRLGIEPGDRVAVVSANNWFFVVSYLAICGVGAVIVPLNPASPAAELTRQLSVVAARVAIVGPTGRGALEGLDPATLPVEHLLAPDRVGVPGAESLDALFPGPSGGLVHRTDSDLAVLVFTAGTAGAPKAAMLTHGNLRANLEQMQEDPERRIHPTDVGLGVLPLFHIFGLNVVLGLSLYAGSSVVLVERFDPVSALETIADHHVTVVAGAPPMYTAWLGLRGNDQALTSAFASVRLAISGAAALPPEVVDQFQTRYGATIYEGYGLTEASPTVTSSVAAGLVRPGSIGIPLPGVEVRLVDTDGEEALVGDEGEIWVRGPNVFAGYWDEPEATAEALTPDGWLRTGDIAVADEDGYLFIVDRAKDVINVSGFNVFPAEVEEVLAEHPGVTGVAVVGVDHPHTGETVKAYVVAKKGCHLEEDELIEFVGERLARYKCPTKVMFVAELPRSTTGKLLRRALR
jgi:long-chain acyl-CoA synthetase